MRYAELQVTSDFSFLRGASSAEHLFATAAALGAPVSINPGLREWETRAEHVILDVNTALDLFPAHPEDHALGLALVTVVPEAVSVLPGSVGAHQAVHEQLIRSSQSLVERVAEDISSEHSGLMVETSVLSGVPADQLLEASRSAEIVAVGSRGYGGFRGLLMGSVSQAVLNDGESPVMIVPTHQDN